MTPSSCSFSVAHGALSEKQIELKEPVVSVASYRNKGSLKRIDACFCCANKQLSMCCSACMERTLAPGSVLNPRAAVHPRQNQEPFINLRMSSAERVLSHRIKTLRVSACNCCQRSGGKNRKCCLWCGTMAISG